MRQAASISAELLTGNSAERAQQVLRYHGKTFHLASRLLAHQQRQRAARLYAFCRYTDDLADCEIDRQKARTRLELLRHAIANGRPQCRVSADFLSLVSEAVVPVDAALDLIDGALSDLTRPIFKTERELIRYSYQVAGTVGLMMCPVLDVQEPDAWPHAIDLGIGMQLTNIARDIAEDAHAGRIYLPTDWTGIEDTETVSNPGSKAAVQIAAGVKRLLDLAESYYDSGMNGFHHLPFRARLGIHAAARMYRDIGRRIAKDSYRSWQKRAHVTRSRKVWLSLLGVTLEAGTVSRRQAEHDPTLHKHLDNLAGSYTRQS